MSFQPLLKLNNWKFWFLLNAGYADLASVVLEQAILDKAFRGEL